jgi:hypothetical protein
LIALLLAGLLAGLTGCASAGAEFRPYMRPMQRQQILTRAVTAARSDVPSLTRAGAIIIGNITARGNGFAGPETVEEAAAVEAARRGGTHLVSENPTSNKPRVYSPGNPLVLEYLVVRLGDPHTMAQLPPRLRPHRGVNYDDNLAFDPAETDYGLPPDPLPESEETDRPANVRVVDGRHLKPLSGSLAAGR